MKTAAGSPRSSAARRQRVAVEVLPVPVGPMISVLVPGTSPPPSKASSSATPVLIETGENSSRCSAATRRG